MSQQGRSVWRLLFQNIIKSFSYLPAKGKYVGEDQFGNKYFEAAKGHKTNKKHPVRWFEPLKEGDWQQNLPAEWEAWLRNRRSIPPTVEEVMKNTLIAQMKKIKGDELKQKTDEERGRPVNLEGNAISRGFPHLEGLEVDPGSSQDKNETNEEKTEAEKKTQS